MPASNEDNPNAYPVGTFGDNGDWVVDYDPITGHHFWKQLKPSAHKASKPKKEEQTKE